MCVIQFVNKSFALITISTIIYKQIVSAHSADGVGSET